MTRREFVALPALAAAPRQTTIAIRGDQFLLNGRPTYQGRSTDGMKIEGLLFNTRVVQGIFDDLNPDTRSRWAYRDTGKWDPERNTREFIAAMPEWRDHGVLGFTINLQGGSPEGYSKSQPWHNSAIEADGSLRRDYMSRLKRILDRADELGMVPIVGLFYFGQDQRVQDETAVRRAVANATEFLLPYRNVLVEIANECDIAAYDHAILKPPRIHELIAMVRKRGLLAGASFRGNAIPTPNVVRASDFLLIHGNGVSNPERITQMVEQTRQVDGYRPMPVLFNEDDHFDFDKPVNNLLKATAAYASWGYFDPQGYQCPPVNWGVDTERKRQFFTLVKELTGA
jgi:hypothetical protein